MLTKLADYYFKRYGLDNFYLQCADTAEKYLDNNLSSLMLKSIYQTHLTMTIANLLEVRNPEILKQHSLKAYKHYEKMHELYKQIDDLGYEDFPEHLYAKWLNYIAVQKEKLGQNKVELLNVIR